MSECKTITIGELKQNNKRLCLSSLRVFGKCDLCPIMQNYYSDLTRNKSLGVKPCESAFFSKESLIFLERKKEIRIKINKLETEYKELKELRK